MPANDALIPVVLGGGSGTRLWPLSREQHPKQLLALTGEHTLLQETVLRVSGLDGASGPIVVCNEEYRFVIAEQLRAIQREPRRLLLEPCGRNTAPALALAALELRRDGDPLMLVMPADHLIRDTAAFQSAVREALPLAAAGRIVTFGIKPDRPETGYGYIERAEGHAVRRFVEKPDAATAKQYLADGNYYWNSGMFVLRASVWLDEVRRCAPDILSAVETAHTAAVADGMFLRVGKDAFTACRSDSIDFAVMEKTSLASCIPLDCGWCDIGAWSAVQEALPRDASRNVVRGDAIAIDTHDSLIFSSDRFVAAVGLDNVVIVETADAVLVANKAHTQNVKQVVAHLKGANKTQHKHHRKIHRPWGSYETIDIGHRFQVKRLVVNPGAALSLQMHHHRAEHWVVVVGTARVTRGDDVFIVGENESTYIPLGTKHRLENPGVIPLEMIEVQSGPYLGEDDIVRFEDRYRR